jgi:hypothetical protein
MSAVERGCFMYLAILQNGRKVRCNDEIIRMLQLTDKILYLLDDGNEDHSEAIVDVTEFVSP